MTSTSTTSRLPDELVASYWEKVRVVLMKRNGATPDAAELAVALFRKRSAALGVGDIQYHSPPAQTANDISMGGYLTTERRPQETDVRELTPPACIALIGRVARRMLPHTMRLKPSLTPEHQETLGQAVETIERIAETNVVDGQAIALSPQVGLVWVAAEGPAKQATRLFTDGIREALGLATLSRRVAELNRWEVLANKQVLTEDDQREYRSSKRKVEAVEHALRAAARDALNAARNISLDLQPKSATGMVGPPNVLSQGLNRDLARAILLSQLNRESVTPRPITPAMFGPLWPDGPPEGWPADPTPAATDTTPEPPPPKKKGKGKK